METIVRENYLYVFMMILLLSILMTTFPNTHKVYKYEPYLQCIYYQKNVSLTSILFTILCFLYPKVCLSHKSTAVTDSELVPSKIAVIYGYALHTKELFSAFKHKIQINNLSLVRRKILSYSLASLTFNVYF